MLELTQAEIEEILLSDTDSTAPISETLRMLLLDERSRLAELDEMELDDCISCKL